jgi:hypothetical protein
MGKKSQPQSHQVTTAPDFAFVSSGDTVALGNVFAVAQLGEEFLVVVGQAVPQLAGSVQDGNIVPEQGRTLPIQMIAQFLLTETRMQELIDNLQSSLAAAKQAKEKGV